MKRPMNTAEVLAETTSLLIDFYPENMCGGVNDHLIIAGNGLLGVCIDRYVNWESGPSYNLRPMAYQARIRSKYPSSLLRRPSQEVLSKDQVLERLACLGEFMLVKAEVPDYIAFENHHWVMGVAHEVNTKSSRLRIYQGRPSEDLEATLSDDLPRLAEYFSVLDPNRAITRESIDAIAEEAKELARHVPVFTG